MNLKWSVHDDARQFAAQYDQMFGGLRLYPFVRRIDCTDVAAYHQSVDDGIKVTVAAPELVPAFCWNSLGSSVSFALCISQSRSSPHKWFDHNPPPGTDYDLRARWNYPGLGGSPDAIARFDRLRKLAPCDMWIVSFLNYNNTTTIRTSARQSPCIRPSCLTAFLPCGLWPTPSRTSLNSMRNTCFRPRRWTRAPIMTWGTIGWSNLIRP